MKVGTLGRMEHLKCRSCGMMFMKEYSFKNFGKTIPNEFAKKIGFKKDMESVSGENFEIAGTKGRLYKREGLFIADKKRRSRK